LIQVFYALSKQGQTQALLNGKNYGQLQQICLLSPEEPKPPIVPEEIKNLFLKSIPAMEDVSINNTPEIQDVINAFSNAVNALGKFINQTKDITYERAEPELWATAVKLATLDEKGDASIFAFDNKYFDAVVGYTVELDRQGDTYSVKPIIKEQFFDVFQTANTIVPFLAKRNTALLQEKKEKETEARELTLLLQAEAHEKDLDFALDEANRFLKRYPNYDHLPEVQVVRQHVQNRDREILAIGEFKKNVLLKAEQAVVKAIQEAELKEKHDWIHQHGSPVLKFLLESNNKLWPDKYVGEKLALEEPGWVFGSYAYVQDREPTLTEILLLEKAREKHPDATLKIEYGSGEYRPFRDFHGRTIFHPPEK
jgi:hypothetical protein